MAINERIEYLFGDVSAGQLAPSQALRTNFTPGKTNGLPNDENWPKDYLVPTSNPALDLIGPHPMWRQRLIKLGRNIVCDQVLVFVPVDPHNETQVNDGRKERNAGYDRVTV